MTGCGPCEEYLPRFRRIAIAYKDRIPIRSVNIAKPDKRLSDAAIKFNIDATPTTLVIDENDRAVRRKVGALSDSEITKLLQFAAK